MSLLFPTFFLFPISACSFFALLVPFLPPKGTTLHSTLCIFLFFSLQACIFFIYLVSFLPKTSLKKDTTLCFHYPHPCALYFVLLSFSFSLSCTYTYTHKKRQLRLIVELPFVLKYTSINLFVREEIQEYVYHFIMIRIVLAQNDAIEILYILFNIRICI